jgi:hypothetical protein
MKNGQRIFALLTIFVLAVLPLLASSQMVRRWVLTGVPMPPMKKILVLAVLENYLIRQEFEDQMEKLLAKNGAEGIQSHMVLPPRNEMMEGELKQRIKESGVDGVLIVRPVDVRKESEVVVTGGVWVPPPGYYNLWPYYNMAYGTFHATSSYTKENIVVRAEFNLYYAKDEKLVWSGETDTVYSKDFDKLGKDYAQLLVKQLKKDKVIGKK